MEPVNKKEDDTPFFKPPICTGLAIFNTAAAVFVAIACPFLYKTRTRVAAVNVPTLN
jgi:hypothetical protein